MSDKSLTRCSQNQDLRFTMDLVAGVLERLSRSVKGEDSEVTKEQLVSLLGMCSASLRLREDQRWIQ